MTRFNGVHLFRFEPIFYITTTMLMTTTIKTTTMLTATIKKKTTTMMTMTVKRVNNEPPARSFLGRFLAPS